MKIYFSGAHGIGKSTLTRYVSEKYNIPIITETARMVLSEKELNIDSLRYDMDLVDSYQEEVFNRQLIEENKYKGFVSDRCLLDTIAYSSQHARILAKLLNSSELQSYLNVLQAPDSFIFFVRPCKATLKQDGVRETLSWDGIISIDSKVHFLLEMFELRYFQINTDSMQERTRLIDAVLTLINTK